MSRSERRRATRSGESDKYRTSLPRGWSRVLWILVPGVALIAGGILVALLLFSSGGGDEPAPLYIYLVPEQPSDRTLLLASFDELEAGGVDVVHTFEDLQEAAGTDTRSIIIDRESFEQVDEDWINRRLADGIVITGIRINFNELTEVVRTFRAEPWPIDFPTDVRFYSYLLHCLRQLEVSEDAEQESLEDRPWTALLEAIDKVIRDLEFQGYDCAGTILGAS